MWTDSRDVRGLPQEKDQIQRAAQDYQRALDIYQRIAPYGNANARIVRVQAALAGVNIRLKESAAGAGAAGNAGNAANLVRDILRMIHH